MKNKEAVKNIYKDYFNDRKTLLSIVCLTFAFILVILLSFGANFLLRPLDSSFLTDTLISIALCIYCLYFGVPQGLDLYKKKENGAYKFSRKWFEEERAKSIKRDNEFNQWLERFYKKNKFDYFYSILTLNGINNRFVLDLDLQDLQYLNNPFKKIWDETEYKGRNPTYFKSMTDSQIELIRNILAGKINVARIPDDFFKTLNGKLLINEYIAQQRREKRNTLTYTLLIASRVIMVILFAYVISSFGLTFLQNPSADQVFTSIWNTLSRIWTMLSSFVYGLSVGKLMVQRQAETLNFKARVNKMFNEDTSLTYVSEEEVAKEEYEKYQKEHKEIMPDDILTKEQAERIKQNNGSLQLAYNEHKEN